MFSYLFIYLKRTIKDLNFKKNPTRGFKMWRNLHKYCIQPMIINIRVVYLWVSQVHVLLNVSALYQLQQQLAYHNHLMEEFKCLNDFFCNCFKDIPKWTTCMRADTMTLIDITKQYVNRYSVVYFMSAFPHKNPTCI